MGSTEKSEMSATGQSQMATGLVHAPDVLSDLDTQLMLQVREGNSAAASTLIRRNFPRVSRFIARVVRHERAVEDLAQEVFLQVLSHAGEYRPTAKFSTWLYRIATNTALRYVGQAYNKRRVPVPVDEGMDVSDATAPEPSRQLDMDELKAQVSAAIDKLPPNQRVALVLFEYEDLSYQQIAAVLNLTVEAVRCLLMRARAALRADLIGLVQSRG
jgi:RNA polymerase sigma-70 factor, ECF subfamily